MGWVRFQLDPAIIEQHLQLPEGHRIVNVYCSNDDKISINIVVEGEGLPGLSDDSKMKFVTPTITAETDDKTGRVINKTFDYNL